jgi:hypothetical protein
LYVIQYKCKYKLVLEDVSMQYFVKFSIQQ